MRNKLFILFWAVLILSISFASAAAPALYFSDMTDAPVSGWEGSATKGAAVTIWGNNFGSTRGSSTVTVCGFTLNQNSDFAEWGATTNPQTARGLERITFFLNSQMQTGAGTIKLTTAEGVSNEIPFYCRALGNNHIYFLATNGNDNNDGLTTATPKQNPYWARANLQAGDIAYFRGGVYSQEDSNVGGFCTRGIITFGACGGKLRFNNGMQDKSITLTSYPGEVATLDTRGGTARFAITGSYSTYLWNYWTISKFNMIALDECIETAEDSEMPRGPDHGSSNIRIIGNDCRTLYNSNSGTGGGIYFSAGKNGTDVVYIYGNYIHDLGVNSREEPSATNGRKYPIYIQGYGVYDSLHIGWNEFAWVKYGRGFQAFGHCSGDKINNFYFHDNYIHDVSMTGAVLGGGDAGGCGTTGTSYAFIGTAYIFNNLISKPGQGWPCLNLGASDTWGSVGGKYFIYNNICYQPTVSRAIEIPHPESVITMNNVIWCGYLPYLAANTSNCRGDHNLYYGAGTNVKPSWDTSTLDNTDPKFIDPIDGNFHLQSSSPAIDAGIDISAIVTRDFDGISRPQGTAFDIGAYEYLSSEPIQYHPADTNQNGKIEMTELMAFIGKWKSAQANLNDVMTALDRWMRGS